MTDIFKCDKGKICCSPKSAIKEREQEVKRLERLRIQHQQQLERNQVNKHLRGAGGMGVVVVVVVAGQHIQTVLFNQRTTKK